MSSEKDFKEYHYNKDVVFPVKREMHKPHILLIKPYYCNYHKTEFLLKINYVILELNIF